MYAPGILRPTCPVVLDPTFTHLYVSVSTDISSDYQSSLNLSCAQYESICVIWGMPGLASVANVSVSEAGILSDHIGVNSSQCGYWDRSLVMTFEAGRRGKTGWLRKLRAPASGRLAGFESHGVRTCLGPAVAPLGRVLA